MNAFSFKVLGNNIVKAGKFGLMKIKYHAPTLLAVAGVSGCVGGTILACRATVKLMTEDETGTTTLEDVQNDIAMAKIPRPVEDGSEETAVDAGEVAKAYGRAALTMIKHYGPAVLFEVAGISCIFASKHILSNRYAMALSAVTTSEALFAKYRQNVIDDLGLDADMKYRYGYSTEKVETPVYKKNGEVKTDKNGVVKTTTEEKKVLNTDALDNENEFARIFSKETTDEWTESYEYNINRLTTLQAVFNQMLGDRGFFFISEAYTLLGYKLTKDSLNWGYTYDPTVDIVKNKVDLGIYDIDKVTGLSRAESMSDDNNAILITFNGAEYIADKIFHKQLQFD